MYTNIHPVRCPIYPALPTGLVSRARIQAQIVGPYTGLWADFRPTTYEPTTHHSNTRGEPAHCTHIRKHPSTQASQRWTRRGPYHPAQHAAHRVRRVGLGAGFASRRARCVALGAGLDTWLAPGSSSSDFAEPPLMSSTCRVKVRVRAWLGSGLGLGLAQRRTGASR